MNGIAANQAPDAVNLIILIMVNQINFYPADSKYRESIINLLQSEKLPTEDLPSDLTGFFIALDNGIVIGIVGLEVYDHTGLLRSLVVKPGYRKLNVATELVNKVEKLSRNKGLEAIYLLTETAQAYFSKRDYETINRIDAPDSIRQSSEFSHVCPTSAILMRKKI